MSGETLRILLVEDNPTDALLVRHALAEATSPAFNLVHAEVLQCALELVVQRSFDLILLDLGLPDSQGIESLARLRGRAPEVPVLVLTGLDDEEVGLKAVHEGAQDYLLKSCVSEKILPRIIRYSIERKRLEDLLRQSQRLDAVGQLAGGIAHDFNNLLTLINGHISLLAADQGLSAASAESVREIQAASRRAAELTRQLLTFSRRQPLQVRKLELAEVVRESVQMFGRLIGDDIVLEVEPAPALPAVEGDAGMLQQVLLNLVVNSRDAMPRGGKLSIRTFTKTVSEAEADRHTDATAGEFVCLEVRDTGTGIPAELLPRIFEPFFTTKAVGKGTGLGLASVYGIVRQHRGWIKVTSEPGRGATFEILLPKCVASVPERVQAAPAPAPESPGGSETILLVEDEAPLRRVVRMLLEKNGYRVVEAENAVAALDIWAREAAKIDLLFTDIVMPGGVSGRELGQRLKAERPDLKVIFTSGYNSDFRKGLIPLGGGEAFLIKPYPPTKLAKVVRDTLDQS